MVIPESSELNIPARDPSFRKAIILLESYFESLLLPLSLNFAFEHFSTTRRKTKTKVITMGNQHKEIWLANKKSKNKNKQRQTA